MSIRLKAGIYVQALVRRVFGLNAAAYVARRGDDDAGGIFIRVNGLDGCSGLLTQFTAMDGGRSWRVLAAPNTADAEIEALLARELARDPDIWVVEIEDREKRHFLEEDIIGEWRS